uniref:Receptor activity modifying protein 2 n=1 Tax=Branchiostoma floridae TaxID=7739 RepID=A0A110AZ68_BRAFL|nr:receptor activity modifying protein 2 [Branchiostoma floridae]
MLDIEAYQLTIALFSVMVIGIKGDCNMTSFHVELIKSVDSFISESHDIATETGDGHISPYCRRYTDVLTCSEMLLQEMPWCNSSEIQEAFPTMREAGQVAEECGLHRNFTWYNSTAEDDDFLHEDVMIRCREWIYQGYLHTCTERFARTISTVEQAELCVWPGEQVQPYTELAACAHHAGKLTFNLDSLQYDDFMKGIHQKFYRHCHDWRNRGEFDPPSDILAACVAAPTVAALVAAILLATWDLILGRKQKMPVTTDTHDDDAGYEQ